MDSYWYRPWMSALPMGVVTFLFTDIEGSTRFWEENPEAMTIALEQHDQIVSECAAANSGTIVHPRGEGDSRFVVFDSAVNGIAAAVAIQTEFLNNSWPTSRPLKVRLAVHTGPAEVISEDYYGSAVNRTARLRSIGHGGQTLISEAAWALARQAPPMGATVTDMGIHRLKDLTEPEHVFQLNTGSNPEQFPPLKSLDSHRNNLPVQLTAFVGRKSEVAQLIGLITTYRLVTVLAPGGMGKTRIALQAAADSVDHFPDGVYFVELAAIESTDQIVQAIAQSIGVPLTGEQPALDQLIGYLGVKKVLLLMDNFEQLVDGAGIVDQILRRAVGTTFMATSRSRLNLSGEYLFALQGLEVGRGAVPPIGDTDGARLFLETARRGLPDFELTNDDEVHLQSILDSVQGTPLGILLAASWTNLLPLSEIAAEINRSLDFLESDLGDLAHRHRSIRAVFDYSWAMLEDSDRQVFAALSVFRGGFTRDAATAVADASLRDLANLASKSFVSSDPRTGRFTVHELLRQFGELELRKSRDNFSARADAHATFFSDYMEDVYETIRASDQPMAIRMMETDIENLRSAWRHALSSGQPELARPFVFPFWFLYEVRGWYPAALDFFGTTAVELADRGDVSSQLLAAISLATKGWFVSLLGRPSEGVALAKPAVEMSRFANDNPALSQAFNALNLAAMYAGELDLFRATADEGVRVAEAIGDPWIINSQKTWHTFIDLLQGKVEEATTDARDADAYFAERGEIWGRSFALVAIASVATAQGDFAESLRCFQLSAKLCASLEYRRGLQWAQDGLGDTALAMGDSTLAMGYYLESLAMAFDLGQTREMLGAMARIAQTKVAMGASEEAAEILTTIISDPLSSLVLPLHSESIQQEAQLALTQIPAPGDRESKVAKPARATAEVVISLLDSGRTNPDTARTP